MKLSRPSLYRRLPARLSCFWAPRLVLLALSSIVAAKTPPALEMKAPGDDEARLPAIAIIIDDMGHDNSNGLDVIALDAPLTLAFLPYRAATGRHAIEAHRQGKEIMLHMPMQNIYSMALGEGALTDDMSDLQIKSTLQNAIDNIPFVSGVNNHMGSQLTQDRRAMSAVMTIIREARIPPLYFIDSRTTAQTVALETALDHDIPAMKRDVFLDHVVDREQIRFQFKRLISLARKNGTAIAIGHPYRETIDVLREELALLGEAGVTVASVSGLMQIAEDNEPAKVDYDRMAKRF
ncbi:divergent polysaccharide deacetylase family protein [Allohahella sp. A8]|uniref:divergent polysaccharide deacetylase family protein n=1 Tax=Allohahella sp. A8 TaxID=3141461 RepID=UPI003A810114